MINAKRQPADVVLLRFHNMMSLVAKGDPRDPTCVETNREATDYILRTSGWNRSEFVELLKNDMRD